jgi:hypothetical protein
LDRAMETSVSYRIETGPIQRPAAMSAMKSTCMRSYGRIVATLGKIP